MLQGHQRCRLSLLTLNPTPLGAQMLQICLVRLLHPKIKTMWNVFFLLIVYDHFLFWTKTCKANPVQENHPSLFLSRGRAFHFPWGPALYFVRRIWLSFLCFLTSRNGTPWNPSGNCHQGTKLPREPTCLPGLVSHQMMLAGGPNPHPPQKKTKVKKTTRSSIGWGINYKGLGYIPR